MFLINDSQSFGILIHIVQRFPLSEIHTRYYHISVIKKRPGYLNQITEILNHINRLL